MEHRNWEWQHFQHQLDTAYHVLRGPGAAGRILITADGSKVALFYLARPPVLLDITARKHIGPLALDIGSYRMDLSRDGKTFAAAGAGGHALVMDLPSMRERARIQYTGLAATGAIHFSKGDASLLHESQDFALVVRDPRTLAARATLEATSAAIAPDGSTVAIAGRKGALIADARNLHT